MGITKIKNNTNDVIDWYCDVIMYHLIFQQYTFLVKIRVETDTSFFNKNFLNVKKRSEKEKNMKWKETWMALEILLFWPWSLLMIFLKICITFLSRFVEVQWKLKL